MGDIFSSFCRTATPSAVGTLGEGSSEYIPSVGPSPLALTPSTSSSFSAPLRKRRGKEVHRQKGESPRSIDPDGGFVNPLLDWMSLARGEVGQNLRHDLTSLSSDLNSLPP